MDLREFVSKYVANYGPFPVDKDDEIQLREWSGLIEGIRADKLDAILERVSTNMGRGIKKPRIRDFRVAMHEIIEPEPEFKGGEGCGLCGGTGWMTTLGWIDSTKPSFAKDRHRIGHVGNNSRLYTQGAPCKCTKGRNLASKSGMKPEVVEKHHVWFDGFATECSLVGTNPSSRIRELVRESIELYGVWPTPFGARRPTMPQERRTPLRATSVFASADRAVPITPDEAPEPVEEIEDVQRQEVLPAGETRSEGETPDW